MTRIRVTGAMAVLAVVGLSSSPSVGAEGSASFHDLGWLAGESSRAGVRAISKGGRVLLGWANRTVDPTT